MKIRNLRIWKNMGDFIQIRSNEIRFFLFKITFLGVFFSYYLIDHQTQILVEPTEYLEEFEDSEEEPTHEFLPGEHKIERTRMDALPHTIEEVDGYRIESVKIIAGIDQSKTIYVNVEPVIAIGEIDQDGNVRFNEFGKPMIKDKKKLIH